MTDTVLIAALEASGVGIHGALLRSGKKKREKKREVAASSVREAVKVVSKIDPKTDLEGPKVKCVLITQGLGNKRDMNYYGPEAITSGASIFEGKPCFIDHPSESGQQDLPERSIRDKCGYFKNVHEEPVNGLPGLVGEIHFDLTESGQLAYGKALTALHYQAEFPQGGEEYVGLSINADGDREKKEITIDGQSVEVNYVTRFTGAMSCDIVTTPARGGRFVALVESAAGAILRKKEVRTMLTKELEAAHSAVKEAASAKDAEAQKKKLAEAQAILDKLIPAVQKAVQKMKESEDESEEESEDEDANCKTSKEESGEEEAGDMASEDEGEADDGDAGDGDSHTTVTHKVVKKTGKAAVADKSDDAAESKRGYLKYLIREAGLLKGAVSLNELARLPLKEAKRVIEDRKAYQESLKKQIQESWDEVPASGNGARLSESGNESNLNSLFAGCVK